MSGAGDDQQTYRIIGAAMETHRRLGAGFLESVYHEAFRRELGAQGVPHASEVEFPILYRGEPLTATYRADLVCFGEIIVELKAVSGLQPTHDSQLLNYLRAAQVRRGLLLNFGMPSLQYKRFVL